MKRCSSCNNQCEDYRTVCPKCGKPLSANAYIGPGANSPQMRNHIQPGGIQSAQQRNAQYGYITPYDHTMEFSIEEISKGKPFAMINYLFGWIGILICLMKRNNSYVQFHVRENVKFMVIQAVFNVVMSFFGGFFFVLAFMTRTGAYWYGEYYVYGPNPGLIYAGLFFFGMMLLMHVVVKILQVICFVRVGMGRAVEAPIVRHFGFLR